MGGFADVTVNAALDALFGSGTPASYDVALSTTQPSDSGAGVTEPVGNAYARVNVTNDVAHWPAAAARLKSNGASVTFPVPTGPWGMLGFFALYKGGTITFVGWGVLDSPLSPDLGSTAPTFDAGALTVPGRI